MQFLFVCIIASLLLWFWSDRQKRRNEMFSWVEVRTFTYNSTTILHKGKSLQDVAGILEKGFGSTRQVESWTLVAQQVRCNERKTGLSLQWKGFGPVRRDTWKILNSSSFYTQLESDFFSLSFKWSKFVSWCVRLVQCQSKSLCLARTRTAMQWAATTIFVFTCESLLPRNRQKKRFSEPDRSSAPFFRI